MKTINKLTYVLFLFAAILYVQAAPPIPGGGGGGGDGTGAPSSPIDMYVYALSVIAIMFIVFFTKKYKSQKA